MTKPYGLPKSEVLEPWNDVWPYSRKKERENSRHKRKTARQRGKSEVINEWEDDPRAKRRK